MFVPAPTTPRLSEVLTSIQTQDGCCPRVVPITFHCPVAPWEEGPVPSTALPWRCASRPWRALRRDAGGRGVDQVTAGLDGVVSEDKGRVIQLEGKVTLG